MQLIKTKPTLFAVLLLGACAWQCSAQPAFDSSGNGQLNGTYYFRQVIYLEQSGDAMSLVGNIIFDGNGNYTLSNATLMDAASGSSTAQPITGTGSYTVAASGEAILAAVNVADFPNDQIVGLVSPTGVFIGSSTENGNGYNDLFIAAPVGSQATNATFSGSYQIVYFDPTYPGDALLTFSANGSGNIGTLNATEYIGGNSTATTQTLSGVNYSFSNGAAQLRFGGTVSATNFISGTEILYITPDGNFVFGGNFNGFDMFVGVRNATSDPANYQALYYQAGVDDDESGSGNGIDSYYGADNILSDNTIIVDQRLNSLAFYNGTAEYDYTDVYNLNGDGSADDSFYNYWASQDGTIRIGYGLGPFLGLNVSFQGPALSPSGKVYISPVGVVNAASNAPFTAFVSPGEFLTLYGTGLAATTNQAGVPFPKTLDGVQVMINGVAAPVYFVSPTQVSVVVPYITTPGSVAQIQVVNSQGHSNIVTSFTGETSAGVFTNNPVGGDGIAASERPDFSIVSESNPAQVGETIAAYLAGMGAVDPSVADGAAASGTTLSNTNATPSVTLVDNSGNVAAASVTFSGLAPGFAGLYQINFVVPSGLVSGDAVLDIYSGADSENAEAILPIGGTAAARPAARESRRPRSRPHARRQVQNLLGRKVSSAQQP
jgi:uncharacterized protein (TIGR03437 family)